MAHKPVVHLERFWLPAGRTYSLTHNGWLSDPDPSSSWTLNPDAVSTRELANRRCLVLLGEPGMGKTSAVASGHGVRPPVASLQELHVDLGVFASEDRLVRAAFENERIDAWLSGVETMCLTLDGFDEALNRVETLDRLLGWFLSAWDCERLFLRLVCRTADWPHRLRGVLEDHFGDANIHELLPLRRADAGLLLQSGGIDAEPVLAAAERARIVPLAARPLTLALIQSSIRPDGSIPESARDLYERGLTALLDEANPDRRGSIPPAGAVARRMQAAQRIAAITVFGGRPTVWTGPVAGAVAEDLTVDESIGSSHTPEGEGSSADHVDAVLRSALFTGAGEGRLTWSHATFADFLSARWIIESELEDDQANSLLIANDGRIYARVRQVAAWLVALSPTRFRGFIHNDPQAFLASVDLPEEALREEVVRALLEVAHLGNLFDDYETDYSGLRHSGLAEQLRPALRAATGDECRVAVRIARACGVSDSVPDLCALALDESADVSLRASAAMTVYDLSAATPSHDLATLIGSSSGQEPDRDQKELQAAALMASWPHAITTEEVFACLPPTHPRNYHGLYSIFLDKFAQGLRRADLPFACTWMLTDISRVDDSRLAPLTAAILRLSVANLGDNEAREFVTTVALKRLKQYMPPFRDNEYSDATLEFDMETRRAIAEMLLGEASEEDIWGIVHQLSGRGDQLVTEEDLQWLIDLYVKSDGSTKDNAGRAAQLLYTPSLATHSNIVLGLAHDDPAADLFTHWRSMVQIGRASCRERV